MADKQSQDKRYEYLLNKFKEYNNSENFHWDHSTT
jgi:hypothetical protein